MDVRFKFNLLQSTQQKPRYHDPLLYNHQSPPKYTTRQMQVSLGTAEPPVVTGLSPATPAVLSRKDPVTARKQKAEIPEQQMRLVHPPGHTAPKERNPDTGNEKCTEKQGTKTRGLWRGIPTTRADTENDRQQTTGRAHGSIFSRHWNNLN
ncbi:hypothetical protein BJX96DRAFT_99393 [Aspergillus floccosus]